ncbi:MAG TPA: methyltransferase domain-containing protein [Burkholderiaceae bacterium]|jgi:ubiquinone/menaquinone biosynthesis C-methylase UbiE|nr:methyltransferase domain-containing protein [Burkholderiaceae bacterium]
MSLPAYAMNLSSFPEIYERCLVGPLFRPWAEAILDDVGLAPGDRVLDVACGTGIVARLARERLGEAGRVVGIDISPAMIAVARTTAPDIDWREGDACALPLQGGETFDVVVCQQGLQFFPDKRGAAREIRRALAAGGRFAIATWRPEEELPLFHALHRVAERHLGSFVDQRHAFGDADVLRTLLAGAGLGEVRVRTLTRTVRFDDPDVFARLNATALVGMSPASRQMDDAQRAKTVDAIVGDSAEALSPCVADGRLAFEIATNLATGRG